MSERKLAVRPARMPVILGSGGGSPATPREADDNYRSKSYLLAIDLLTEGPIVGPIDSSSRVITDPNLYGKAILYNKVPLLTDSGTFTIGNSTLQNPRLQNQQDNPKYADLDITFTTGTQDQPYVDGFPSAEEVLTPNDGTMSSIKADDGTIVPDLQPTVEIDNPDADTIEVGVQIQSLVYQDKKTGNISGNKIGWNLDISLNGGDFNTLATVFKNKKISSPAMVATLITLPKSSTPQTDYWILRVTKTTADSTDSTSKSSCSLAYVRVSTNVKLTYPNCAVVYVKLDSANVQTIPQRAYRIRGLMIQVPNNYFPTTRKYTRNYLDGTDTGVQQNWNGGFYLAWTNNPAWIIYDLMTNDRYGLGNYINPGNVDKWSLYQIAQYCDQKVPDDKGGKEPRFTFNAYFQTQDDAFKMLQKIAAAFLGAAYWGSGTLNFVQDRKIAANEIVTTFTNANVQNGLFEYSSTAASTRHTVCNIQWADPSDNYQPKYETFQDSDGIHRYGIRTLSLPDLGCTTRGQARRFARLMLYTEINLTGVVSFTAGFEGAYLRPNDVVKVMDNDFTSLTNGGRLKKISADRLTLNLDRGLGDNAQQGILSFIRPTAFANPADVTSSDQTSSVRASQLIQVNYQVSQDASILGIIVLNEPLDPAIGNGAIWIFEGQVLAQLFRVLNVEEKAANEYAVSCCQYSDAKYDYVDEEHIDVPPIVSNLPNPTNVMPPQNPWVEAGYINQPEGVQKVLYIHWKKPNDPSIRDFLVEVQFNNEVFQTVNGNCPDETATYIYQSAGTYTFRITSLSYLGTRSIATTVQFQVNAANPLAPFTIQQLELYGQANGTQFATREADFEWQISSPVNADDEGETDTSTLSDTAAPAKDPMFDHADLVIFRLTDGQQIWAVPGVTADQFKFTADMNNRAQSPTETEPSGPYREFMFQVTGYDKYGNPTVPAQLTVNNPQVAKLTNITAAPQFATVLFYIPNPGDLDFEGVLIWQSEQANFIPSNANLVYDGPAGNIAVSINQEAGAIRYYIFAGYDAFGKDGLNYSDVVQVTNNYLQVTDLTQDFRDQFNITVQNAAGAITQVTQNVDQNGNSTVAGRLAALYAVVGDVGAVITDQDTTLASLVGADARRMTRLFGQFDVNDKSQFEQDIQAIAAADTTSVQYLTTLGSLLNSHDASIQTNIQTINGLKALYSITLDNNGSVSGLLLTSEALDPTNHVVPSALKLNVNALILTSGGTNVFTATAGGVVWNVDQFSTAYVKALSGYYISTGGRVEFGQAFLRSPIHFYPVGTPSISPGPGTVQSFPVQLTVTAPDGATIRFTRNNTDVTPTSKLWPTNPDGSFSTMQLGKPRTLRLRAYLNGAASPEILATYSLTGDNTDLPNCADPSIHNSTVYPAPAQVKLKCATPGNTISYVLTHANGTTDPAVQYAGGLVTVEVGGFLAVTASAPGYDPSTEVDFYNVDPTALPV